MQLKDTLNLPQTKFPMRGDLVRREPDRLAHWEKIGLHKKFQQRNTNRTPFILHDGPPFTNGDVHIGTALNKIIKDVILKYKTMCGQHTPYIPGWDCHGLPIEYRATQQLRQKKKPPEALALRRLCAEFSAKYIELQRGQFQRLGVLANWGEEYKTMQAAYEAEILRTLASFVKKGFVYRSKKPVHWSIPCQTALAEAEIEYQNHVSEAVWVKFPVADLPKQLREAGNQSSLSVLIWTTTPWTLPANLAVAVHPQLDYVELEHKGERYLVAAERAEAFLAACELEGAQMGRQFKGIELKGMVLKHPFIKRESPLVFADYVSTESGTGCVHIAPGHGLEDYKTGLENQLEIYCPVDGQGCYVDDGEIPKSLVGLEILAKDRSNPANAGVLALLESSGALLAKESLEHSYPHCWRSKTPLIFRATKQWFVALGNGKDGGLRELALKAIGQVKWTPASGQARIQAVMDGRPDWCISRQRVWGVPIPVFYDENDAALLDAKVIEALADKVEQSGSDIWFEQDAQDLLKGIELPEAFRGKTLSKGMDTLDVWMDSGCSHQAVLARKENLNWPADLYFEGSDQHRGWFQSSLLTGLALRGKAPYRQVITHGFVVDEHGQKISKSKGAVSSDDWVGEYGADIVRLWVSSQDYQSDTRLSKNHFKSICNTYRSIRNTLMYQLGNLFDFDPAKNAIPEGALDPIDQWALWKTDAFLKDCQHAYENFELHRVYQQIDRFCGVTLSRLYHDILKDRLYTLAPNDPKRRSSQTAMLHIFKGLCGALAPILSFTADEAFGFLQKEEFSKNSIHLQERPEIPQGMFAQEVVLSIEALMGVRNKVNEVLEGLRKEKLIGKALDAAVCLKGTSDDEDFTRLQNYDAWLPELFCVSQVHLENKTQGKLELSAEHAKGVRCPRSWRWVDTLVPAGDFGEVSARDHDILAELKLI